jgi:hypothetical protein
VLSICTETTIEDQNQMQMKFVKTISITEPQNKQDKPILNETVAKQDFAKI